MLKDVELTKRTQQVRLAARTLPTSDEEGIADRHC